MSRLVDDRTVILEALEAGGITVSPVGGQVAAPCVLVEPGDPWCEPRYASRIRGRVSRWRLQAVAGAADTLAGYDELAELVDQIDAALRIDGVSSPTWAGPAVRELEDGVRRRSTIGTIEYATSS